MTKSFFFITALVLGAGALTGLLLPAIMPYPTDKPARTFVARVELAMTAPGTPELRGGDRGFSLRNLVSFFKGEDAVTLEAKRGPAHMMLNQNVVVLNDPSGERGVELPKGTQVRLIANEGRFVRVRYGNKVVTIPRSAIVVGVARTN